MKLVARMGRRVFLTTSAMALLLLPRAMRLPSGDGWWDPGASEGGRFLELIRHERSAATIGSQVKRLVEEAGWGTGNDVFGKLAHFYLRSKYTYGQRKLRKKLLEDIENDFREGRMVNVEGWLISETEAVICWAAHSNLRGRSSGRVV